MPFIPHTEEDVKQMLSAIGAEQMDDLFDEIPDALRCGELAGIPEAMSEFAISREMQSRAAKDQMSLNFVGAGAYEHHIPAAVWQLTTRGEFYTAYTPYQAEASQGTLQIIYEFQSMMAGLTGLDVSNASLYDGASALAEAVLMAVRANRKSKSKKILMPESVHPAYRATTHAIVKNQDIELVNVPVDPESGRVNVASLDAYADEDITALVVPQPNFFGVLEDVDALTNWATDRNTLVVGVVNPLSLAVLKAPGEWGEQGADIVCGEGQPLGAPLSSGGPYYGLLCCKQAYARQMPGRIVGRTTDADGKDGFVLTLQAREQHIRRSKATSNICTNQGLVVTASTIYMSLLGPQGLASVASHCYANTHSLAERLQAKGVQARFTGEFFHELLIQLDQPATPVIEKMADKGISGGYVVDADYPGLENTLLVCVTETKSEADLDLYVDTLLACLT